MDEILKLLHSPGWWFTAVFVGLFVAILGGLVAGFLFMAWDWNRQPRAATLSWQEQELEFLLAEPTLLTLYYIHAVVAFLLFFSSFAVYLLMAVWTAILSSPSFSSLLVYPLIDRHTLSRIIEVVTLILGALSCLMGFIAASRLSVSWRAYRRLYARKMAEFYRNPAPPESG